jgi:hypothetical protein
MQAATPDAAAGAVTLASIVSVKIHSCVTKFEDESTKRKKCVHNAGASACRVSGGSGPRTSLGARRTLRSLQVHGVHD